MSKKTLTPEEKLEIYQSNRIDDLERELREYRYANDYQPKRIRIFKRENIRALVEFLLIPALISVIIYLAKHF